MKLELNNIQGAQLVLNLGPRSVLYVMLHADGSIKRMGTNDLSSRDGDVYVGVLREPLLARFLERLPESILKFVGKTLTVTRLNLSTQLPEDIWVLRLLFLEASSGETRDVNFQWAATSTDLPGEVPTVIQNALDVTEEWYQAFRRGVQRRRSMEDWDGLIANQPDNAEAFFYRGQLHCNGGQYELGVRDLSESIRLEPTMLEPYLLRGQAYFFMSHYEQAIADFDRVLSRREEPAGYLVRGNSYAQLGRFDLAVQDFENVLRLEPQSAPAYYHRARSYALLDQPQRAIADYSDSLRLKPDNANAYFERGGCYQTIGQTEKARSDFNRAFELEPGLRELPAARQLVQP